MQLINQSCLLDNNRASGGSQRNAAFETTAKQHPNLKAFKPKQRKLGSFHCCLEG